MTPTEYAYARRRLGCTHADMRGLIGISERTSKRYEIEGPPQATGMLLEILIANHGDLASIRRQMLTLASRARWQRILGRR